MLFITPYYVQVIRIFVDSLSGISIGVGRRSSHLAAGRVEFLYLGRQINIREALGNVQII